MRLLAALLIASAAPAQDQPTLLEIAAAHVAVAESTREDAMLWGRLGGSEAERTSARMLAQQLRPSDVEPVEYSAYRPQTWAFATESGAAFASAMPAPFDAWMPNVAPSPIVRIDVDDDWTRVSGVWAFVEATTDGSAARTNVREQNLYQRAVENGAVGFVFSLPTPPGTWRSVVPVDKPFALPDEVYPSGRRPIPSFSVDAEDGARLRELAASGARLGVEIQFDPSMQRKGLNTVSRLEGDGDDAVMLACHLDSFFAGANDDASGIAVLVGLYRELQRLPASARKADFWFVGLSGHHDEGAGMRAFAEASPARMASIKTAILLEHLDMHPGDLQLPAGATPLNDRRAAYTGPNGWPEIEAALPELLRDSGLMTSKPPIVHECIADLFVICDRVQPFCLMAAPPYYHTDRDTLDKLTEEGLRRAVDFHMRLLAAAEFIEL
jgi:hypothetical protein